MTYKNNIKTNVIYCGDCLEVLKKLSDNSIDLIYLDPPFFTNKKYENFWVKDKMTILKFDDKDWYKFKSSIDADILKQYQHIEERWKGGSKGLNVFIAYMRERINQCERVLKPTGSIYLHCDWHAGHYLKQMMDEVFDNNFQNEIIWAYRTGGATKKRFSRKHDTIFFYSKSDRYTFNSIKDRIYYDKPFFNPQQDKDGKYYADVLPVDVWEIPAVINVSKERLGYPTQKPESLMERIIKTSSNPSDIVLDPFCGCGTTIAVAQKLGRRWIGIDMARTACDVMKKRIGGNVRVIGGETMKELKQMDPHEFARLIVVEKMDGIINPKKTGDKGIDGWIEFKTIPIQVKHWKHNVSTPSLRQFKTDIENDHKDKGIMVAFEFTNPCYETVAKIKKDYNIEIQLKTVKEIMGVKGFIK